MQTLARSLWISCFRRTPRRACPPWLSCIPVRKDVTPSDEHFAAMHKLMDGVEVWAPDWAQVLKDLQADVAKWHEATGS
jgi:hypothetical protein